MSLPARQQRALLAIDQAIEARDPRLAAMFRIFTRLNADDAVPRHERLARGEPHARRERPWPGLFSPGGTRTPGTAGRSTVRISAAGSLALLACLMAIVAVFVVVGFSAPGCPRPPHPHQATSRQAGACRVPALPGK